MLGFGSQTMATDKCELAWVYKDWMFGDVLHTSPEIILSFSLEGYDILMATFIKKGKLDHNPIKAPMGVELNAGDLQYKLANVECKIG